MVETTDGGDAAALTETFDALSLRTRELEFGANNFARAMTGAFARSVVNGKQFDDVLKSLYLRMSEISLRMAMQPVSRSLAGGLNQLVSGLFSGIAGPAAPADAAVTRFASGGIIGAPTYFPLSSGGLGLAGEAGAEAIMPLARGADGRLGVAAAGVGRSAPVVINITTADAESFRRSEVYVAAQIARAVSRGQRGL